jgi:hypothetical protein
MLILIRKPGESLLLELTAVKILRAELVERPQ